MDAYGRRSAGAGGAEWRRPVLGVDIGGVVIQRTGDEGDTSFFGETPMLTPAVPGAFDALAGLARDEFRDRVHLVSKAKLATVDRTLRWLDLHDFTERTGIPVDRLHFVPERADKAPVCARLGVTHFVDDRIDVLRHLGDVPYRYLFTGGGGTEDPAAIPEWARQAAAWTELAEVIRLSVRATRGGG
ncbi:hypothetical protein [Streptomonospora wellingtoniae]|uniref:Uncharacterized protein n=1 Tax=Streptomonospora wellingtoniae TaxID=3075544 RepID=A0ABU2KYU9_9ACTN|nr:hypothetical protein [Streptomonospora sp. DSM 45055]MDT0304484.1 hypothetical protein [Streptomonospora sp. DSM 45055]